MEIRLVARIIGAEEPRQIYAKLPPELQEVLHRYIKERPSVRKARRTG